MVGTGGRGWEPRSFLEERPRLSVWWPRPLDRPHGQDLLEVERLREAGLQCGVSWSRDVSKGFRLEGGAQQPCPQVTTAPTGQGGLCFTPMVVLLPVMPMGLETAVLSSGTRRQTQGKRWSSSW